MIDSGDIAQRTKAITDELHAMKSKQNLASGGVRGANELYTWNETVTLSGGTTVNYMEEITFRTEEQIDYTPLVVIHFMTQGGITLSRRRKVYLYHSENGSLTWRIKDTISGSQGSSYTMNWTVNVYSLVEGTLSHRRIT